MSVCVRLRTCCEIAAPPHSVVLTVAGLTTEHPETSYGRCGSVLGVRPSWSLYLDEREPDTS
jgi:hypothetical protein